MAYRTRPTRDIFRFVSLNLEAEWPDRDATILRVAQKSGGILLWAELVVNILNAAIGEGASRELIHETILEMPGDLDGLYEWLLSTLSRHEKAETLALFQWAILASKPMRLNEIRTAVRLTKSWTVAEMCPENALSLDVPASLQSLRQSSTSGSDASDSPEGLRRWLRQASIGLLEVTSEYDNCDDSEDGDDNSTSNNNSEEPLQLQRVTVIDESVREFFLSGRGFAALDKNNDITLYSHSWSTEDLSDLSHYVLLNACIACLGAPELDVLSRSSSDGGYGSNNGSIVCQYLPMAPLAADEVRYWRQKGYDQRRLIIASYPFLAYAVDNLIYHMLSPHLFRYHLPQKEVLHLFIDNGCRLWKRWTTLLGVNAEDSEATLEMCSHGPAKLLLDPVYGARYRLERVFRRASKIVAAERSAKGEPTPPNSGISIADDAMTVASAMAFAAAAAATRASEANPEQEAQGGPPEEDDQWQGRFEISSSPTLPHSDPEPAPDLTWPLPGRLRSRRIKSNGLTVRTATGNEQSPRIRIEAEAQQRHESPRQPRGRRNQRPQAPPSPIFPGFSSNYSLSPQRQTHEAAESHHSTYVPSVFSPATTDCGSGSSISMYTTIMSPLSALEASFDITPFQKPQQTSEEGGGGQHGLILNQPQ